MLRGLEIQERLASLKDGDQYFVPVVEKIMENGELICHVEPEGQPVDLFIRTVQLDLKQELHMFRHMLEGVGVMHAQKVANLDIKLNNMIMKDPVTAMKARFCDFDLSIMLDDINTAGIVPIGTYESMCREVLQKMPYLPVMADLWATVLTAWRLMALERPSLHWLSGILDSPERRGSIWLALAESFPWLADDPVSEEEFSSDDESITSDDALLDRLRWDDSTDNRKKLQLFFWSNLEFPDDIYKLRLLPAERCILKEMLSIMFLPSSYSDKFQRMMSLITAASRCASQVSICFKCNEEKILQIIQESGYQPCERVERLTRAIQPMQSRQSYLSSSQAPDGFNEEIPKAEVSWHTRDKQNQQVDCFMIRKGSVVRRVVASQSASWADLRNMLIDYLACRESLDFLEEKNDSQLFAWLIMRWRLECSLPNAAFRPRLAC